MFRQCVLTLMAVMALLLTACGQAATESTATPVTPAANPATDAPQAGGRLQVVATTTIVGDVVRQIGGDAIDMAVLLPYGVDPHSFNPTPQDVALVARADVIFVNGAGLEEFLDPLLENAGGDARLVAVSDGIELREFEGEHGHAHDEHDEHGAHDEHDEHGAHDEHDEHGAHDEHGHAHEGGDPHTWTDPNNVMVWTENIERTLRELDPANAATYAANAEAYRQELAALDAWVREQIATVPEANRQFVTDHLVFGYFADRYGLTQVGAIIPAYSSAAEPSAREMAELEDTIRDLNVRAIFVGDVVNPGVAQRVAEDTGTQLVYVLTESLTAADGPAPTYLEFMRYNVNAIVTALRT